MRKGQLLAALVADDEKIGLAKAEFRHANARMAFERGEDLTAKELLSREDMDKLRMDFRIAEQELAEAQWKVQKTEIRAPFTGQISERMIQIGKHVRNGDELFQITDFDRLIARIYFPETDVIGLEDGRSVRLSLNATPGVQFEGRIRHVSNVVDVSTGTVKSDRRDVRGPLRGPTGELRDRRHRPRDATRRPQAAQRGGDPRAAFGARLRCQRQHRREATVTLGLEEGGFVEALAGVDTGEQVIVLGQGGLKNGSEIEVLTPTGEEVRES